MDIDIKTLDRACLIAVLVISLVFGYVFVSRGIKQYQQVQQENELLSRRSQDLTTADTNLQRIHVLLESTKKELQVLNESIPDSAQMGEFLKQLDHLMNEQKVVLVGIEPLETVKEKMYTRIPLHLLVKGSFVNIYYLLYNLEKMNRTLVMEKMSITTSDNTKQCQVDLTANVFER